MLYPVKYLANKHVANVYSTALIKPHLCKKNQISETRFPIHSHAYYPILNFLKCIHILSLGSPSNNYPALIDSIVCYSQAPPCSLC